MSGGAHQSIVKRIDGFLDEPLAEALAVREERADAVLKLDDAVSAVVERLKARGLTSPYLKAFVVSRINYLRFGEDGARVRQRAGEADPGCGALRRGQGAPGGRACLRTPGHNRRGVDSLEGKSMANSTVLVVDDDRANLDSVARIFQHEGLATLTASDGEEGLALLRRPEVGVLVTDLMMPGLDGRELLRTARSMRPDVEVVLMTAYGTVEAAVSAMKDGAYDFITKPLKRHALVKTVQRALEHRALMAENESLKARLADLGAPGGRTLIGQSPAFRALMETLRQAAAAHATVLPVGESGTGKRARRPCSARAVPSRQRSLCRRQLRGYSGDAARVRALRRGEGRVHRCPGPAGGTLRAGPRRHAVSGRGWRALAQRPW